MGDSGASLSAFGETTEGWRQFIAGTGSSASSSVKSSTGSVPPPVTLTKGSPVRFGKHSPVSFGKGGRRTFAGT
jgi:hypothetical protein